MPRFARNDGFTLAEVLITLVIIGVIAALTVPTLMNQTNNQEYVAKLKKAYSTLAQATNLIISEEGTPNASKGGWASSADNEYKMYKKYLNMAKDCGSDTGCMNQLNTTTYKYLNNNSTGNWDAITGDRRLVLTDGTQVMFEHKTNDCISDIIHGSENVCAVIIVDLNGEKKPNIIGRDVFSFALKENALYPCGCEDSRFCVGGNGNGCACKVLREGAMNY